MYKFLIFNRDIFDYYFYFYFYLFKENEIFAILLINRIKSESMGIESSIKNRNNYIMTSTYLEVSCSIRGEIVNNSTTENITAIVSPSIENCESQN